MSFTRIWSAKSPLKVEKKNFSLSSRRNLSKCSERSKIYVLGRGDHGQLGLGIDKVETNGEWIKSGASGVKKMWTGPNHAFLQDHDEKLWGWGKGENGQLLSENDVFEPKLIKNAAFQGEIMHVSCGSHHTLCLVKGKDEQLRLYGWGSNQYGELGLKELKDRVSKPQEIPFFNGKTITAMSCGEDFSVVATTEGIYSFGRNDKGQLGTEKKEESPFKYNNIPDIIKLSSGWGHTLALDSEGNMWSWGANLHSQCGSGRKTSSQIVTKLGNLPSKVVDVQCGSCYTMAKSEDGGVWIWGSSADGKMLTAETDLLVPTRVSHFDSIEGREVTISSGIDHLVVLKQNQLWGWGFGQHGVFGPKERRTVSELVQLRVEPKDVCGIHCTMDTTYILSNE